MTGFHRFRPERVNNCRGCGTDWPDVTKPRETVCPICNIKGTETSTLADCSRALFFQCPKRRNEFPYDYRAHHDTCPKCGIRWTR